MAVISVSIVQSEQQIISGIPKNVSISVSIPSTIFYTLDGTTPTPNSSIYMGPILLPTNNPSVTLKIFASNGIDESAIITQMYAPSLLGTRKPHDTVIGLSSQGPVDLFPYGSNSPTPIGYGPPGGVIVDSPEVFNIPDGYDGTATQTFANGTDLPKSSYKRIFSTRDSQGVPYPDMGTLPNHVKIIKKSNEPTISSKTSDSMFNPRALVIYQDSRDPTDEVALNRDLFSLPATDYASNKANLRSFDTGNRPTGSFLRQHYNPKDNTMTYYYRDSDSGRWIISVEPFTPSASIGNLSNVVFSSRSTGSRFVYKWVPFMRRVLI